MACPLRLTTRHAARAAQARAAGRAGGGRLGVRAAHDEVEALLAGGEVGDRRLGADRLVDREAASRGSTVVSAAGPVRPEVRGPVSAGVAGVVGAASPVGALRRGRASCRWRPPARRDHAPGWRRRPRWRGSSTSGRAAPAAAGPAVARPAPSAQRRPAADAAAGGRAGHEKPSVRLTRPRGGRPGTAQQSGFPECR